MTRRQLKWTRRLVRPGRLPRPAGRADGRRGPRSSAGAAPSSPSPGGVDSGVVAGICVRAWAPSTCCASAFPSATAASESSDIGLELANALGARTVEEPITDALEALGCYRRRDEAIRRVFPDYEPSWRHKLVRSPPTGGHDRLLAGRRAPGRDRGAAAHARRRLPRAARRVEHEAADPQAARVHLGGPALLRGRRDAEPARVRPGVLRQGRRRPRRPEADRRACTRARSTRSLASSGSPSRSPRATRRPTRSASRRPRRSSTSATRYEQMDLLMWGHDNEVAPGGPDAARSASRPTRSRPPTARSSESASPPSTSTPPRCLSIPPTDRVRDRRHRAAPGRATGRRSGAAADGAGDSPSRARRLRARARPGRRPRLDPAGDRRPARAAGSRSPRTTTATCWSTTARSTTTSSSATSSRRGARRSRPPATPRWSCACSSARASTALDALQRPVRVRLVAARSAPADAGSRPLRGPPASLRAAG